MLQNEYPLNLIDDAFHNADLLDCVYIEGVRQVIDEFEGAERRYIDLRYRQNQSVPNIAAALNVSTYDVLWTIGDAVKKKLQTQSIKERIFGASRAELHFVEWQRDVARRNNTALIKVLRKLKQNGVSLDGFNLAPDVLTELQGQNKPEPIIPLEDLDLAPKVYNLLKRRNLHTLNDISHLTEKELLAYKNVGIGIVTELRKHLTEYGKAFRMPMSQTKRREHI